ncbi:hypothetical protein H7F33_15425 [Pedobacter sp. PAMC26386]|nr:hypothetical protein H7F33_15425 [Pedobacter sp. PAMC26386]
MKDPQKRYIKALEIELADVKLKLAAYEELISIAEQEENISIIKKDVVKQLVSLPKPTQKSYATRDDPCLFQYRYGIVADDSKPVLERLSEYAKVSADINGRDHLTILAGYVATIAEVVGLSDSNKKSKSGYYKLAIGSFYNDGKTRSPDFDKTFNTLLSNGYFNLSGVYLFPSMFVCSSKFRVV